MSGGDAPLKVCQGNIILKVCCKITGTAAGEEALSHSYCFSLLMKILFGALMSSEKFCQDLEMVHKATKNNGSPFTEICSWCEKNMKTATCVLARGVTGSAQSPGHWANSWLQVQGKRESLFMCHIAANWKFRSPSVQSPSLPSSAWLGMGIPNSSESCLSSCSEAWPHI